MTIKKRLFVSNILMIAVPAAITALVGIFCLLLLWLSIHGGGTWGPDDDGDFTWFSRQAAEQIRETIQKHPTDWQSRMETAVPLLQAGSVTLEIVQDGETAYVSETISTAEQETAQAAAALGAEEITLSSRERSMYLTQAETADGTFSIRLYGSVREETAAQLKLVLAMSAILLLFVIFLSILATNRFLVRFVFQRVEQPLDILAAGARELGSGNLNYHLAYEADDEFKPVCDAFNEMAAQLRSSIHETIRQEESRKELLAGISHDLRSPLTSIQAYVEGLIDGVAQTPEARRKYLLTIKTKAEDISHMVSQLFLFSKMELEEYPMSIRPICLDRWLDACFKELEPEYRARELALAFRSEPVRAQADPEQLRRVLINILDNSAKYKAAPVGHLTVTLTGTEDRAILTLADDGPGVPKEALPKLFNVFYRSDPARQNPAGGSGLGLAIAAKAVERMGGTIAARNGRDGGLEIIITLQREDGPHEEDPDRRR